MSSEIKNRLEICNIEKKFKKNEVLKKLSCTLESGVYAILAPNGVGKTTLMRCIADIYTYNGEILFNGKNIKKQKIKIGYLPQQFGLFPELTVYQMMEYFCNLKKISKKDRKAAIDSCLKQVNLYDKKDEKNRKLSGGMVRRVGIAQAILGEPDVILLDEPTAGLDPEERMRFKNIINNLTGNSIVLISTHIVEDVEACCESVLIASDGKIKKQGTVEQIQECAKNRIIEIPEEALGDDNILFVEKSYIKDGRKIYRVITKNVIEDSIEPTVEDGYLCLLKED